MTTRRRAAIIYTALPDDKPYSVEVFGPVRVVHPTIQRLEIPWQWDARRKGWLVPRQALAELEAALTADGHFVQPRAEVLPL